MYLYDQYMYKFMFDRMERPTDERYFFTLSDEIKNHMTKISEEITKHTRERVIDKMDLSVLEIYPNQQSYEAVYSKFKLKIFWKHNDFFLQKTPWIENLPSSN